MYKLIFASTAITLLIIIPAFASGEVYIPDHEYVGFYDHDGIYTVIGGVKNNEMYPVIPTITVSVNDGGNIFSQEYKFSPIMPAQMLPLKLKLSQITTENPVLEPPQISYKRTEYKFEAGYVLYDSSLILHDDGRMTGKIKNAGDNTFQNFRIYALIKDQNEKILDVASSQRFAIMHPGEILEFEMIPDPKIFNKIDLYSCFAFGDESILPLNADRNGEQYTFRYESGVAFMNSKFNSDSTELEIDTLNSFVGELNASFEFPQSSINEEFEVYLDDGKIANLQSLDEMGNWHVYFTVPGFYQGDVTIKGFHEPDGTVEVPEELDLSNMVATEITTGKVTSIIAKTAENSIVINLETAEDGVLSVTTSDFLIRPFNDGGFLVAVDGEKIDSVKYENKILIIPYTAQTEKVEVYGSYVIPEFGTVAVIVLAAAVISIIVLSRKHSMSYSLSNF
ncbi:PEFG-CTERM sorting domain-containing protein [Marine Group I thaumarchaeote]|uniref:PEFG-CTERM sorting domain-containing protein n=1 Tax=Marine Group I thaumarchaeote TaxID=2511932 RepID=A0A7K4NKM1_9ARCH|nr:PEFG-CTERM sorting domain-containing protein [Marine Group I thaumarchaeote]